MKKKYIVEEVEENEYDGDIGCGSMIFLIIIGLIILYLCCGDNKQDSSPQQFNEQQASRNSITQPLNLQNNRTEDANTDIDIIDETIIGENQEDQPCCEYEDNDNNETSIEKSAKELKKKKKQEKKAARKAKRKTKK